MSEKIKISLPRFRTQSDRERMCCCSGCRYKEEKQLRVIDGVEKLEVVGKTDVYEKIQSHADSVDLKKILEKCALMDDYSLLNRMPAQFMDVTDMPKTYAELQQRIIDGKNFFNMLPTEVKEAYDNSAYKFMDDVGTEQFYKRISPYYKKASVQELGQEVKTDGES